MRLACLSLLALVLLPGCAMIIDGTTQPVTIRTGPVGASCSIGQNGVVLGTIPSTPGTLVVHRNVVDLAVTCQKPGWATAAAVIKSRLTGVTAGNIFWPLVGPVLLVPIGTVVDDATGANYRYAEDVTINMTPQSGAGPSGVVTVPAF